MKENQRIIVTKRMLKEGLLRLLETKDLKKIKINELCEEAGINRATFYRHYETPEDVLWELEREISLKIFPKVKRPANLKEAQKLLEKSCAYIQENSDIMKLLFRSNVEEHLVQETNEFYQQILELRKQERQYADVDDDTLKMVAYLFGGGCYWMIRQWIIEDIPKTPEQIAALICNVFRWPDPKMMSKSIY